MPPLKNALAALSLALAAAPAWAEPILTVTPVFAQLVSYSLPEGFSPAFERAEGATYIQESLLEGQELQAWSEMITLTGSQGLSADTTAVDFANIVATNFGNACPDTIATEALGAFDMDGHEGFIAWIGCGSIGDADYSEVMILIVIAGREDIYTLQWAERSAALDGPPSFDAETWQIRLDQLAPVRICDPVEGEGPPYPSCTGG